MMYVTEPKVGDWISYEGDTLRITRVTKTQFRAGEEDRLFRLDRGNNRWYTATWIGNKAAVVPTPEAIEQAEAKETAKRQRLKRVMEQIERHRAAFRTMDWDQPEPHQIRAVAIALGVWTEEV
jgi:hypothetical protein